MGNDSMVMDAPEDVQDMVDDISDADIDAMSPEEVNQRLGYSEEVVVDDEEQMGDSDPENAEESDSEGEGQTKDEIAKLKQQIEEMKKFIGKQSNEVSKARQLEAELKQLRKSMESSDGDIGVDDLIDNPSSAIERALEKRSQKDKLKKLEQEYSREQVVESNRSYMEKIAPDYSEYLDDVVELVRSDLEKAGEDTKSANNIKNDFLSLPPAIAVNLVERAKLSKELKSLRQSNQRIETVNKKASQALRSSPTVTGRSGRTANKVNIESITESDIEKMSPDEVARALDIMRKRNS